MAVDPVTFKGNINDFPDLTFVVSKEVEVTLPEAESAQGGIVYSLSPDLTGGLSFDNETRQIRGTPSEVSDGKLYRYTATDVADCRESLEFRVFVQPTPYTYGNQELISLLPPNATDFEKDLEVILRENILPVDENQHSRMPIIDAWNPETIPEHLIPYLGANFSIAIDSELSAQAQRNLLKRSYELHKIEGTPQALLDVIFALGYSGAAIIENDTDSDGNRHWANYSISLNQNVPIIEGQILINFIKNLAPTRCTLVGVNVTQSDQLWDGSITFDGTYSWGSITDSGLTI